MTVIDGRINVMDSPYSAAGDGVTDDTTAIQDALDAAHAYYQYNQPVGATSKWTRRAVVIFPVGTYQVLDELSVDEGVDIEGSSHSVLRGDGTTKCFNFGGNAFRTHISRLTFVGFTTAIQIATNNNTDAILEFHDLVFQVCEVGIDTVSYSGSRSTIVSITNCTFLGDQAFKIYTDVLSVRNCWFEYHGQNHELMLVDSLATFQNCLGGAINSTVYPAGCFIKFQASDYTRGLSIRDCRFGTDGAISIPTVHNYARGNQIFGSGDERQVGIVIEGGLADTSTGPSGHKAPIVLFNDGLPNFIQIRYLGGTDPDNGMVAVDSSFHLPPPSGAEYGWWKLNDNTGTTAADSSLPSHTGTLTGSGTLPTWPVSHFGGGVAMNPTYNQCVSLPPMQGPQSAATYAMWVNISSLSSTRHFFSQRDVGGSYYMEFGVATSGQIFAYIWGTSTIHIGRLTNTVAISTGSWVHVAFTWNGGTSNTDIIIYVSAAAVDHNSDGNGTFTAPNTASIAAQIGGDQGVGDFSGTIHDVRVYPRALSAGEISELNSMFMLAPGCHIAIDRTSRNMLLAGNRDLVAPILQRFVEPL